MVLTDGIIPDLNHDCRKSAMKIDIGIDVLKAPSGAFFYP
jgi:hypothetical protein